MSTLSDKMSKDRRKSDVELWIIANHMKNDETSVQVEAIVKVDTIDILVRVMHG